MVITTAQVHSTKPQLKSLHADGVNPVHGVLDVCDDENLWQCSLLKIRHHVLRWSTIPQKPLIIINFTRNTIPSKISKHFLEWLTWTLQDLFTRASANESFLDKLGLANITPIFKKGNRAKKNCGPASVFLSASKVFERLIKKQTVSYVDKFLSTYFFVYWKEREPKKR